MDRRYHTVTLLLLLFLAAAPVPFCAALELKSEAFGPGERIPAKYTGSGDNVSPPLAWSGVPGGTRSLVLIMEDPDAPMGTWIHWVVFDIPGDAKGLGEDVPRKAVLQDGARQGLNSFRWVGYGGPFPPPGPAHRYFFRLYALDVALDIPPGAAKGQVVRAMQGHILDEAELMGVYGR